MRQAGSGIVVTFINGSDHRYRLGGQQDCEIRLFSRVYFAAWLESPQKIRFASSIHKRYTLKFKFQVVRETLREDRSATEVARLFGVRPVTLSNWKRPFLDQGPEVFSGKEGRLGVREADHPPGVDAGPEGGRADRDDPALLKNVLTGS